jgi:hypothetical protein
MRVPVCACVVAFLLGAARPVEGQTIDRVEVTALSGYRFGGEFYEIASGRPVDADGAVSFSMVLNIPLTRETQIEALFTHQQARFAVPDSKGVQESRFRVTVDHYQVGGLTELSTGRARPFLTGLVGLTRYETSGDHELRFSASAGGGVKLFPIPHAGVRLDGRVIATLVDARADVLVCSPGICVGAIDAWVVWQAELVAGIVVRY